MKNTRLTWKQGAVAATFLFFIHCGNAGSRVGNPPTTTTAFPSNLAIASLTDTSTTSSASLNSNLASSVYETAFSALQTNINSILNGTKITDCAFDTAGITSTTVDATCYGPLVAYENHPDATGDESASGDLPPGDVGIWNETEDGTEACASAEQNTLIGALSAKTTVALEALASMICVINNDDSVAMPASGTTVPMTTAMNDMALANNLPDLSFSIATLSLTTDATSGNDFYSYELVFTDTIGEVEKTVSISMKHMPLDATNENYKGQFSYHYNATNGYNQYCDEANITDAGSIIYNLASANTITFQADEGIFCGANLAPFDSTGILDPTDIYGEDNTDGWTNDYTSYRGTINIDTQDGDTSFAWQAGSHDFNSRVFNLHLETNASTNLRTGDAFFGFGPGVDEDDADGRISGFICNWAGPGSSRDLKERVQYQQLSENSDGIFEASLSKITYAPTESCNYLDDNPGFGIFSFDSDGDGSVDTDPSVEITNDLQTATDSDSDGYLDVITDIGFTLPVVERI